MDMLRVEHVSKSFGSKKVVTDLSFSIPQNSIFGFVGQNGAGKTTTMKMILGLMKMDAGEIYVDEKKVVYGNTPTNKVVGYLPDVPEFYTYMTPKEYLTFCGEITGMNAKDIKVRADELLKRVGLANEKKKIKGFSRGMKQRLGIAQALMGRPKFLICDEPTSALDPMGRKELLDILVASKEETTIMFSTHILSDVEKICDRIAFLHQGSLALSGTIDEIKKINTKEEYEVVVTNKTELSKLKEHFAKHEVINDYTLKIFLESGNTMEQIMSFVLNNSIAIDKIEKCENSLENLFMEVVG